jgi:ketosteroid isomerase-like protein
VGAHAELIERIYGFDWATVGTRRTGFAELREVVAPEFESKLSPELGERVLFGVKALEVFVDALEQDFSEFHYDADEFTEVGDDSVLVVGRIFARARATGMPLSGEFGHIWTVRDGQAAKVEAHRDRDEARKAAGVA